MLVSVLLQADKPIPDGRVVTMEVPDDAENILKVGSLARVCWRTVSRHVPGIDFTPPRPSCFLSIQLCRV